MIDIIRKEPLFKKLVGMMLVSIIIVFIMFTIFQYNNLKNIYLEQSKINKILIGTLVSKYPEDEVNIVKSVYNKDDKYIDLGQRTLDKFGYDKNYSMYKNVNFQEYLKYFLVNNLIVFAILITLVLFMVFTFIKYVFKRLLKVYLMYLTMV